MRSAEISMAHTTATNCMYVPTLANCYLTVMWYACAAVPGPGYEWSSTKGVAAGCRAGFFKPAAGTFK